MFEVSFLKALLWESLR